MRQRDAVVRSLMSLGVVYVFLLLMGGRSTLSFCEGAVLPDALLTNLSRILKYFCNSNCESGICRRMNSCSVGKDQNDEYCDEPSTSEVDVWCDDGKYLLCMYDEIRVCTDDSYTESCMYYDTELDTKKCCKGLESDLRCSRQPIEVTTKTWTPGKTTLPGGSKEPFDATTALTAAETTSPAVQSSQPSTQSNAVAIVLGSVLSATVLLVLLGIFCLYWKNRLPCGRPTSDAAGVSVEMHRKDEGNTYQIDPYYSQIQDEGGTPGEVGRNGHAHDDRRVMPSAPPVEKDGATESQADHQYFVLEREPAAATEDSPDAGPNNHDYFVLERDDTEGNDRVPKEGGTHTTSTPGAGETTSYDHIRRPEAKHGNYTALNLNPEYDQLERVGQKVPREGVVHDKDKLYSKLES